MFSSKIWNTFSPDDSGSWSGSRTVHHDELSRTRCSSQSIEDLPITIHLYILSYLEPVDLSRLGVVSKYWQSISQDNILWKNIYDKNKFTWKSVGNIRLEKCVGQEESDIEDEDEELSPFKKKYYKYSPGNCVLNNAPTNIWRKWLKSLFRKKVPKIVMFGPGLESSTSEIASIILGTTCVGAPWFKPLRMNSTDGGSNGLRILVGGQREMHLVILYSTTKKERNQMDQKYRCSFSKYLTQNNNKLGVNPSMRHWFSNTDGFIYVVDATVNDNTQNSEVLMNCETEVHTVMEDEWIPQLAPLAVLSCVRDGNTHGKIPCINVAEKLKIDKMTRPWQVHDIDLTNLNTLFSVVEELIEVASK